VIDGRDSSQGFAHSPAGGAKAVKGLRRRDFVDKVQIHVKQCGLALRSGDDVFVPDLFEESSGHSWS
jgi:hypothetical protein